MDTEVNVCYVNSASCYQFSIGTLIVILDIFVWQIPVKQISVHFIFVNVVAVSQSRLLLINFRVF